MSRKIRATQQDIQQAWFEAFIERHNGRVSPRILLEDARDPNCPLHDAFEWDDDAAAEQFRLIQAGQIIRRWRGSVIRVDSKARQIHVESVRRVQSPASARGKGQDSYETIEQIMADPAKREDMIQTVLRELASYRKRYAGIIALSEVWEAIDNAIDLHAPRKAPVKGKAEKRAR